MQQRKAKTLDQLRVVMDLTWLENKDYRIVNTKELLDWAIRHIKSAKIIGLDTETTGLNICDLSRDNPIKDKIVGMSISWERNQGIYIPFEHVYFDNLPKKYVFKQLRVLLETKSIVTHNGLFDGKVFYDEGIKLNITQDTMLMYFNLDSTVSKGSKGLKAITTRRYGYEVIELGDIFESESDAGLFQYVEYELTKAYACADSDHTLMIFMDTALEMLPGQIRSYRLDVRVQNHLIRSEYFGKGINMELLSKLNKVNNDDIAILETIIYTYVGTYLLYKHTGEIKPNMYRFNIGSSQELAKVFFNLLKYPVPEGLKESGKFSVDKYTLRALKDIKTDEQDIVFSQLQSDNIALVDDKLVLRSSDKKSKLMDWEELYKRECKVAFMVDRLRKLEKLRSSFFSPLLSGNFEGRYFSGLKMTRAETARIVDFIQTLDKSLKKLVVPLMYGKKKQYLIDFDFAQIEYRVMAGEAGVTSLVERLDDFEADYHREGGSLILNKAPEDITGDERSSLKSINFGIPYGMSDRGILQNRYGIGLSKEESTKYLHEIQEMLVKWNNGLYQIADMLNSYRDKSLIPVSDSTLPHHLKGKKIGRIANKYGRTRLFNLEDLTKQKIGSIRRQAGNYPIQSYAREIFCTAFCDFCDACIKDGLMDKLVPDEFSATGFRFENKINIMAYIHDECLMSVDSDVNHEYVYKLVYENCMKKIPGYPRFYCGINVIDNWYEGKDDKYEAPVGYVEQCIEKNPQIYVDPNVNHKEQALAGITSYMIERIGKELYTLDPQTAKGIFNLPVLVPLFKNYFVKPKVAVYIGLNRKVNSKASYDDFAAASIEAYAYHVFENPQIIGMNGEILNSDPNEAKYYYPPTPKEKFAYFESIYDSDQDDTLEDELISENHNDTCIITDEAWDLFNREFSEQTVSWSFRQ